MRHITFGLSIGHEHTLKFTPREHKDELSLRYVALPTVVLTGDIRTSRHAKLPRVSLELTVKQLSIDLTTDVLNQVLILQNSFIKVRCHEHRGSHGVGCRHWVSVLKMLTRILCV